MYAHFKCEWNLEFYVWLLQINLQACHEYLTNRFVWSWYMCRLDPLYFLTFIFYVKKLFKHQSIKRERVEKALLQKLVWLEKGRAKCIQNLWCRSLRLIPQRNIKKFMALLLKNWVVLNKKYEKWKPNENLLINVNTLVRDHICSFLLVR